MARAEQAAEQFDWFEPSEEALNAASSGAAEAPARVDVSRHHHLAKNILDSYSRATDLLAEVLQNATDAIDTRSEMEKKAPRVIEIDFDAQLRRIQITDTGTGMPRSELKLALAPNVSYKSGGLAKLRKMRARGEKGVGVSFIALSCNELSIRSCDGRQTIDASIKGANDWLRGDENMPPPKCHVKKPSAASERLGSSKWTSVTISKIETEHFDADLFAMGLRELTWRLRTETAVGNTAFLFTSVGLRAPEEIKVGLRYTSARGTAGKLKKIPYRYQSPEELILPRNVVDFADVKDLEPMARRRALRGKALRYVKRDERSGGRVVYLYTLVVDGREMTRILKERVAAKRSGPPKGEPWQRMALAVRDMPAGVELGAGVLSTRGWEQRLFALLQYDDMALDLGRKTMAARTQSMLRDVVADAWSTSWGDVAQLVKPSARLTPKTGREALALRIKRAQSLPALDAGIPFLKQPATLESTQAIFHELISAADSPLDFSPLSARVFASEDALIYQAAPNGKPPMHVVFGVRASEIIEQLEGDDRYALTADLAVVWEVDKEALDELGLRSKRVPRRKRPVATHEVEMAGIGERESLRFLSLRDVLVDADD